METPGGEVAGQLGSERFLVTEFSLPILTAHARWLMPLLCLICLSYASGPARASLLPDGVWLSPGGPVARFGTSTQLHCMAWRDGDAEGVFFGDTGCGTLVATDEGLFVPDDMPGANPLDDVATPFTPVAQSTSGDGSAGSPFKIRTVVAAGAAVKVEQVDTYRLGNPDVHSALTVTNGGAEPRVVTVFRAADCYAAGDDDGYGALSRFSATCVSAGTPRLVRLMDRDGRGDVQTWEGASDALWRRIAQYAPGGGTPPLSRRCDCTVKLDNAIALQWTVHLAAGESVTLNSSIDVGASLEPGPLGIDEAGVFGPDPLAQHRPSLPYVALGDSYSSGEGAGIQYKSRGYNYIAGTDTPTNRCHRSWNAYPILVARHFGLDPAKELAFRACSGATISNLTSSEGGASGDEPPQMDAIGSETRLVTVSIGGNDAGFSSIMRSCLMPAECDVSENLRADGAYEFLKEGLPTVLRDMRRRTPASAPVLVLGYPDFVPFFPGSDCHIDIAFLDREKEWLSAKILDVNGLILKKANASETTFVDVGAEYRKWSSPHRICQGDEYVNGVRRKGAGVASESIHPNAKGHAAFARHVVASPALFRGVSPRRVSMERQRVGDIGGPSPALLIPGVPTDFHVSVLPGHDATLSLRTGLPTGPHLSLLSPGGQNTPLIPDDPLNTGQTPGTFLARDEVASAVFLYGQSRGIYTVRATLPADSDGPVLAYWQVTANQRIARPPLAIVTGRVGKNGMAELSALRSPAEAASNAPRSVEWSFGDGGAGSGDAVQHQFVAGSRRTVRVRVRNGAGLTSRGSVVIDTRPVRLVRTSSRRSRTGRDLVLTCSREAVESCLGWVLVGKRKPRPFGIRPGFSTPVGSLRRGRVRVTVKAHDAAIRPRKESIWTALL